MKTLSKIILAGSLSLFATLSNAATYEFVGSWFVDDGPWWSEQDVGGNYTTPVFSGVEAAAFIFGGNASDYAISTVSDQVADINFSAWMDGWGDANTYGNSGIPAAHDLHIDTDGDGLYAIPSGFGNAYSAYVDDHGLHLENFAFKVSAVPEPSTYALMLGGLGLVGFMAARRRKQA